MSVLILVTLFVVGRSLAAARNSRFHYTRFRDGQHLISFNLRGWVIMLANGYFAGNCFEKGLTFRTWRLKNARAFGLTIQTGWSYTTDIILFLGRPTKLTFDSGQLAIKLFYLCKERGSGLEEEDFEKYQWGPFRAKRSYEDFGAVTTGYVFGWWVGMDI